MTCVHVEAAKSIKNAAVLTSKLKCDRRANIECTHVDVVGTFFDMLKSPNSNVFLYLIQSS